MALVRAARRPRPRCGLTPAGAWFLGLPRPRPRDLRDALLRTPLLDGARLLLTEWYIRSEVVWALSPYTVSILDLMPTRKRSRGAPPPTPDMAYVPLRLDALACLQIRPHSSGRCGCLNVAVMTDPGWINMEWFYRQFRSAYSWGRRDDFRNRAAEFPLFVLIAANDVRRGQLIDLWRECAPWGQPPESVYVTTWEALGEGMARPWWNERGARVSLWSGAVLFEPPGPRPSGMSRAFGVGKPRPIAAPTPSNRKTSILSRARKSNKPNDALVRLHLEVSEFGRWLLDRIGDYPLLAPGELALVTGYSIQHIHKGMAALSGLRLIEPRSIENRTGYVLAGEGIALVAAQAGHTAEEYAALRCWPVQREGGALRYSTAALEKSQAHTRLVWEFLLGLRRAARKDARLRLVNWDHVQRPHVFYDSRRPPQPGKRLPLTQITPDAVGRLRLYAPDTKSAFSMAHHVDTEFWLEVDRGSHEGRRLREKLANYFRARNGRWGPLPRLLVVVERDAEGRARLLARRWNALAERYGTQPDALITRVDLMEMPPGLDPLRKVWRRPEQMDEFVYAFDGLPLA